MAEKCRASRLLFTSCDAFPTFVDVA
ncbi:hypothetical protein CBM2633_A40083 [Cupriavidus taiwanensis]|uniref:Uncharacterized protein n=1 Tax=Cupriavidus taiwanensis TaxID=164546 RepID=A0A976AYA8_9BURK|nr:hypothetical protein CBM2615_A60081 [Cupriavidus taiwanensis]SOZ60090.1 hypothetical protein CBM2614_A60080 [Cupriavidus taiwanensis]SOZ63787.1 hypothetical protein CBM2613_A50081 [Cupriavidus taiwanensis]SOZ99550.1 hypothetical protein CBM2626_A40095 [Cupriavidus taiwanensis]SPA06545.1 hypothetical protein CBM2625_A60050 [Cupriavidus taiwanensis]